MVSSIETVRGETQRAGNVLEGAGQVARFKADAVEGEGAAGGGPAAGAAHFEAAREGDGAAGLDGGVDPLPAAFLLEGGRPARIEPRQARLALQLRASRQTQDARAIEIAFG